MPDPLAQSQFRRYFARLRARYGALSRPIQSLIPVWAAFFLLVGLGVHGSSIPCAAEWWDPGNKYSGYVFDFMAPKAVPPLDDSAARNLAMVHPREVRSDEWLNGTMAALSQFSHTPRFPVINTNMAGGQNMLVGYLNPVWHITALARPITWGFFLLGRERGLAWEWWFQTFSCFTVLFLLLEVILRKRTGLAAFGAFWFCGSAYVICWSLWPAYHVLFPALACLAAYHLFSSEKPAVQISSAVLLGLSIPGFAMLMYPPWEVALTYLFVAILIGLVIRDRLYRKWRRPSRSLVLSAVIAILIAAGLGVAFLLACKPAMQLMAGTVYPGRRINAGGGYSLGFLFKGMYNPVTSYSSTPGEANNSEAASFFYVFPAILAALCLSRRLARGLGAVGWMLVGYIILILFYGAVGLPFRLAKISLLGLMAVNRVDIGLGLASIILTLLVLSQLAERGEPTLSRKAAVAASVVLGFLVLVGGIEASSVRHGFPPIGAIVMVCLAACLASYFLLTARQSAFCYIIAAAVIASSSFFNPLSNNIKFLYGSEIATEVQKLNGQSGGHPLWVCYGPTYPGILVWLLGGRSVVGIQWPPQVEFWRRLDPAGEYKDLYNRYAHVQLKYEKDDGEVSFDLPKTDTLVVGLSPSNPVVKSMGARYILATYWAQKEIDTARFPLIFQSADQNFSVFEIPAN
jgi:hypothetical protein